MPTLTAMIPGKQTGGKLAVIQDPFGRHGGSQYLGATTPIPFSSLDMLSIADDGKTLYARAWLDEPVSRDANGQYTGGGMYQTMFVWNAEELVKAALAAKERGQGNNLPIDRVREGAGQFTPIAAAQPIRVKGPAEGSNFYWLYGLLAPSESLVVAAPTGRYGDIVGIDLKELIRKLPQFQNISDSDEITSFTVNRASFINAQVVTDRNGQVVSRSSVSPKEPGEDRIFYTEGKLFLAPEITDSDLETLRAGGRLPSQDAHGTFTAIVEAKEYTFTLALPLKDYEGAQSDFFGDRDLKDPGYSEFALSDTVQVGSKNVLDVYRVEQRLRYLGFSAFIDNGNPTRLLGPLKITDFKVDGSFGNEEKTAVQAFYEMTNHADFKGGMGRTKDARGAVEKTGSNFSWLNAYNAPHWMNIYDSFDLSFQARLQTSASGAFKDGTSYTFEIYGTSWERDMLKAWELQAPALALNGLWSGPLTLNGLSDSAFGPRGKSGGALHYAGGHSIGMSIDLGLGEFIDRLTYQIDSALPGANPSVIDQINGSGLTTGTWSLNGAETWSGYLPDTRDPDGGPLNDQRFALRNFLALYAVTRDDGVANNGVGWDNLTQHLKNPDARNALFGTGDGLISHLYIGGEGSTNPYKGMNEVLKALGIDSSEKAGHHNHFHIDLRTPTIRELPRNLLADHMVLDHTESVVNETLRAAAQGLLHEIAAPVTADQGDLVMFVMDVPPDVPAQYAPIVVAEAAQAKKQTMERTIGVCQLVSSRPEERLSAVNSLGPIDSVWSYLRKQELVVLKEADFYAAKMTLLEPPKHGELKLYESTQSGRYFAAEPNYEGSDQATILVEIGGYKVTVKYFIKVMLGVGGGTEAGDAYDDKKNCPNGRVWRISLNPDDPNAPIYTFDHPYPWTTPLAYTIGANLAIADLPHGALGQTTGTTITLDNDAAGHGWFIDATPWSNEEYLPTHNPNVWVAREGSSTAGRMDLLSVLLHEYGHALPPGDRDFSRHGRLIESSFSRALPKTEHRSRVRQEAGERGIWPRHYGEHLIREEADYRRHVDHVHVNPLKHGHVQRVRDWPYSTFHRYVAAGVYPGDWYGDVEVAVEGDA